LKQFQFFLLDPRSKRLGELDQAGLVGNGEKGAGDAAGMVSHEQDPLS